mmetsp:Transcript_6352/g.9265  ORF Transcript_6352/g.9265 Transcript_6352/m.9265 type:complete len:230 (+) Transcript_6352:498-1187(+)
MNRSMKRWKSLVRRKMESKEKAAIRNELLQIKAELGKAKVELFSEQLLLAVAENSRAKCPRHWAPFRSDKNQVEIEIINATNRLVVKERDQIIRLFIDGGVRHRQVVSLKRIQNREKLQKFLTEIRKHHELEVNVDPFEKTHYLFHGPKNNVCNILKEGGLSTRYARSGTHIWLHKKSSYSVDFSNQRKNGNHRMFICRAIANIGYKGKGVFIFNNDHQVLIEYLIEWN